MTQAKSMDILEANSYIYGNYRDDSKLSLSGEKNKQNEKNEKINFLERALEKYQSLPIKTKKGLKN